MPKLRKLNDNQKKIISKTHNQSQFIRLIANMSDWEYKVFYAFYPRLRIDTLNMTTKAGVAYRLFLDSGDVTLAQKLVSNELMAYRPAGVATFAELLNINALRNDDAVSLAVDKAISIGTKVFKVEYPNADKFSPLDILKTVLEEDHQIILSPKKKTNTTVYDALREEDADQI